PNRFCWTIFFDYKMVNLYYFVFCKISHRSTNFLNTSSCSSVNCSNILLKSLFFCVADCINILSSCSIKTKFSLFSTFNLSRRSVGKVTTLLFPTFLIFLVSSLFIYTLPFKYLLGYTSIYFIFKLLKLLVVIKGFLSRKKTSYQWITSPNLIIYYQLTFSCLTLSIFSSFKIFSALLTRVSS